MIISTTRSSNRMRFLMKNTRDMYIQQNDLREDILRELRYELVIDESKTIMCRDSDKLADKINSELEKHGSTYSVSAVSPANLGSVRKSFGTRERSMIPTEAANDLLFVTRMTGKSVEMSIVQLGDDATLNKLLHTKLGINATVHSIPTRKVLSDSEYFAERLTRSVYYSVLALLLIALFASVVVLSSGYDWTPAGLVSVSLLMRVFGTGGSSFTDRCSGLELRQVADLCKAFSSTPDMRSMSNEESAEIASALRKLRHEIRLVDVVFIVLFIFGGILAVIDFSLMSSAVEAARSSAF